MTVVIPIRRERPRDERARHVEAAMKAIREVERQQPWLTQEPPPGSVY